MFKCFTPGDLNLNPTFKLPQIINFLFSLVDFAEEENCENE